MPDLTASNRRFRPFGNASVAIWLAFFFVVVVGLGAFLLVPNPFSQETSAAVKLPEPVASATFDADQAYAYLQEICRLGPRISDTPAMRKQIEMLARHFEKLGARVERQEFKATQPSLRKRQFTCVNLLVNWHPASKRRVLIGCHYDTRPIADRDPIPRNRDKPILGANDGASGVAFLMELGRVMPTLDLKIGVDFVFFDAEEYIFVPTVDDFFIGSEEFVRSFRKQPPGYVYDAVVVVDMIGDKNLEIHAEERSSARAGRLVQEIWDIADERKVQAFHRDVKFSVDDDHIAFLDNGIPAVVLIDFDYPHWHRLTDTPDKCSGESLRQVSTVLVEWLRRRSAKVD